MLSLASPIKTPYHQLRPAIKFAFLCGFTLAVFLVGEPVFLAGAFVLVVALYLVPGVRFGLLGLKRMAPVWPFVAIIAVWHVFTGDHAGGIEIGLRLLATVALANLVTMTSRLDDLAAIARRLLAPFERIGVNSSGTGIAVALVVRFTPVLVQKTGLLIESWRSRSRSRPGWRLVIPVVALALDDADHVAESLRARGGV